MTYNEAKDKLKALKGLKRLVRAKARQIQEEREQIGITAVDYSKERVSGGSATSMQQRFAEHMERLEAEYDRLLDRMREIEDLIAEHLGDLTDIEQEIIVERYMHNKSWRQIEKDVGYSTDSVYRIHRAAIQKISQNPKLNSK